MTVYVTEAFKRHVPDWEHHVHHPEQGGERVWSEYGEGWLDGYDCGEADADAQVAALTAQVTALEAEVTRHVSERQAVADITDETIRALEAERDEAVKQKGYSDEAAQIYAVDLDKAWAVLETERERAGAMLTDEQIVTVDVLCNYWLFHILDDVHGRARVLAIQNKLRTFLATDPAREAPPDA